MADGRYLTLYQESPGEWRAALFPSWSESCDNQLWKITCVGNYYHEIRSVCVDYGEPLPYCISADYGDYSAYAGVFDVSPYDTQYGYLGSEEFLWRFSQPTFCYNTNQYMIYSQMPSSLVGPFGSTTDYRVFACMDAYGESYERWVLEPYRMEAAYSSSPEYWLNSAPTDTFNLHCSGTEAQTTYRPLFQQAISSWNSSFADTSISLFPNVITDSDQIDILAECLIVHKGSYTWRGNTYREDLNGYDIIKARIEINVDHHTLYEGSELNMTRVQGTIAHEIGHLLGLGDNPSDDSTPNASLMNYSRNLTTISVPQEADTQNVYRLYGPY